MEYHAPVLLEETVARLVRDPGGRYLDGTLGGGGHSRRILEQLEEGGRLLCIDQDTDAIRKAGGELARDPRVSVLQLNFGELDLLPPGERAPRNGILLDLGVSSHQIDTAERGFSYLREGPLDMRMNRQDTRTAADLLNTADEGALCRVFQRGGDLNRPDRMAAHLATRRERQPFRTTGDLASAVEELVGTRGSYKVLSQVFQALRMEINGELDALRRALALVPELLQPEGVLAVITYHSGEDRMVKRCLRDWERDCFCPPELPLCACAHRALFKVPERKGRVPGEEEIRTNPRARSARLRWATRTTAPILPDRPGSLQ